MTKATFAATAILAAGTLLLGPARAQQAPAEKSTTPPSKTAAAPARKTPRAHSAKSGNSTSASKKPAAKSAVALTTPKQKYSYAIGLNIGKGMHKDDLDVDPDVLLKGLKDGLSGANPQMTDDEIKSTLTELQAEVRKTREEMLQKQGEENIQEGQAFLAANKTKEGVVTLPDGLQYKVLKEGTGPKPTAEDRVICNYRGTLIDGTEFDSSY
ncbi:MAG: FKBP-type peptidyl-prolyl cis-trans isomerase N-terminal domain-containing protein, partial [Candidatus Acidiferrales bacterium]